MIHKKKSIPGTVSREGGVGCQLIKGEARNTRGEGEGEGIQGNIVRCWIDLEYLYTLTGIFRQKVLKFAKCDVLTYIYTFIRGACLSEH